MASWQETYEQLKKRKKQIDNAKTPSEIKQINIAGSSKKDNISIPSYTNNNTQLPLPSVVPLRTTVTMPTTKKKEEKRTWLNLGAFDDGYDFGDITKTILGTSKNITQNLFEGAIGIAEKGIDAGAYGIGLLGDDKLKQDMQKFIEKDLIDEEKLAEYASWTNPTALINQLVVGNKSDEYTVLGEKSQDLVQSAGQLAGTMGLQYVGVPWWLTTGTTSFGGEVEQAFKKDATYGEAGFSGLVSAGAEILTEKISGGISFGGKTLDQGLKKVITEKISNKALSNLIKFGLDATGEGFEEVATEFISTIGQQLSYEREETWQELLNNEEAMDAYISQVGNALFGEEARANYGEAFIGGAVLGGGANLGKLATSSKTGRDYDTGLTTDETVVVEAETNRRIDAQEQAGKKLTAKEKAKIEEQVKQEVLKKSNTQQTQDIAPTNNTIQNTQETVEDIDNQIAVLEEQLSNTESDAEYERLSTEIKELEDRANQLEQQEIAPVQIASVEQTQQPTTQEVETNLATDVVSNTQNIENVEQTDTNAGDVVQVASEQQTGQQATNESQVDNNIEVGQKYVSKAKNQEIEFKVLDRKGDTVLVEVEKSTLPSMTKGAKHNVSINSPLIKGITNNKSTNIVESDTKSDTQTQQNVENSAETLQTAERTTPTQEELDNLEYTRKNKSGSEYASEYYALGNKYGTTNLYKALNNYKSTGKAIEEEIAPIRHELAETTKELVKTIKDTTKEVTKLKKELNEVKESVSEIVEEGKALTEADLPYIEQIQKEAPNQDVAPIRNNLTTEESQELDMLEDIPFDLSVDEQARLEELQNEERATPEEEAITEAIDPFKDRDYENIRKSKAYQYEHPEVRPFFQAEAKTMLGDLNNSQKGERYVIGDISQTGNGDYQFSGQKRHTTEDIAYLLDSQYGYTYDDIRKGLNAIIEDHGAENIAVAKRIEFALNDRLLYGYTDLYGEKMPPNQDYIDLLKTNQWNDYFDSLEQSNIPPYEATSEEVSNTDIEQEYNKLYLEELNRLKKRQEELNVILKEGNKELLTDNFIEELAKQNVEAGIESGRLKLNKSLDIAPVKDDFDNGGPLLKVSPKMEQETTNKNVDWEALEDTSKGNQQSLKVKKLGETLQPNKKDLSNLEDTSKGNQQQFNTETMELEDSIEKKTKKQIKQELLQKTGIMNESLDNANKLPKILMENTDPIRLQEMIFGRGLGTDINKMFFHKVKDNTSEKIRFQNKERAEIKALGIKARSKESAAVQKYGEKQWTNETTGEVLPYGDKELASEFPNVETQKKIKQASEIIRQKYDSYLDQTNKVLTSLGYDAIPKRKDYMRHFQELNDIFSRVGIPYNYNEMIANDLPTDINGLTADFSPSKNFFASALRRKGTKTTYDAITGIDGYLEGIGNLIYHTEDIQRLRAYEQYIRDTYGENHGFDNLETLTDEEKVKRIEKIQDNHLSNYASWLHEYTNTLAGKKALVDRSIESLAGRSIYSFLNTTKSQVGKNMIGFNLSSALTNVIAEVQALAKTNKLATVKGLSDTVKNIFVKDGFVEKNNFLTSRFGSDMLSKNLWQRMGDAGFIFMQGTDNFISQLVVRSKYNELKAKGLSDQQAHDEAGKFASRIMGDRSQGATANLYNSQMLGIVTQFQLEVNNQLYSMFYDTYHESKERAKGNAIKTGAGMTYTLGQLAVLTHLFGAGFEAMAGYNPTFDIIGMLMTAFGLDDEEEDEDTTAENLGQAFEKLVDALPYVNIITGGGRIPISEALPLEELFTGKDEFGNDKSRVETLKEALPYYVLPTGYGQIKKTTQGLGMYDEDLPIAGSYTDSGNLRFTAGDSTWDKVQAGVFGRWANKEAQAYVDSEFKSIDKENIDELIDLGMTSSEYRKLKEDINKVGETKNDKGYIKYTDDNGNTYWYDKKTQTLYDSNNKESNTSILDLTKATSKEQKIEYIDNLDLTTDQKNILVNNMLSENLVDEYGYQKYIGTEINKKGKEVEKTYWYDEKNDILYDSKYEEVRSSLLDDLVKAEETNVDMGEYDKFATYEEFDFSYKNPKKYEWLKENDISYDEYTYDEDTKDIYDYAYNNPEVYKTGKAITGDFKDYMEYKDYIYDLKADKDKNGKSISGSRKTKVISYVNELDLTIPQKAILIRQEYSTFDDYNYDIVDYVDNLDIDYEDKVSILEGLDMKVSEDGTISW